MLIRDRSRFYKKKLETKKHHRQISEKNESLHDKSECKEYFDSAELSLSVVTIEYNTENERSNTLTTRSGLLLSVMVVAATFILQNIRFDMLIRQNSLFMDCFRFCAFFVTTIFCLIGVVASLILLIITVITKSYERIDCKAFDSDRTLSFKKDKVAASVIKVYINVIQKNSERNKTKAKLYNAGALAGVAGIFLAVAQRVLQEI